MSLERYRRIQSLLQSALEREPGERRDFLEQACADDEALRRQVESLIVSHEQAEGFLETPAAEMAARLIEENQASLLVAGQTLGPYKVLSLVGSGGMGEVYLAEDTRLRRKVALKLLHAYFTADVSRLHRFEQEACAASALNHPNILTIYEFGQADSSHFIVSEFVGGETLRERLTRAPVPTGEALDIAAQVASALEAAHEAGIIHRDIKPENVMVRHDGFVKVLDFGLAKLAEKSDKNQATDVEEATRILLKTSPGMIMGTVSYMSPEQSRGEAVDKRTDIWSLGVVLYEMVAGRLPFEGEDVHRQIIRIQDEEPPPLSRTASAVPERLEEIVRKALAKDPDERYRSAEDLLVDLRRLKRKLEVDAEIDRTFPPELRAAVKAKTSGGHNISTSARLPPERTAPGEGSRMPSSAEYIVTEIRRHRKGAVLVLAALATALTLATYLYFARVNSNAPIDSLAVLPFANLSGDPNTEYLSDGMTESIINDLSQLPQLRVMARSTVFRYKGKEADPRAVGRELSVRAVLTGRVLQQGDNLVIKTELVNVADGAQLWGSEYDRKLSEVIGVQQEIAREISEKLRLKLTGSEQRQLAKRYTDDTEAYQLYLRGRYYWNKRTPDDLKKSVEYFQRAIDRDPSYALAYAGLADAYGVFTAYGMLPPGEAFPQSKAAARKALEIDDTLAEAHTTLASALAIYDWDWAGSEREFERAIELNPNYATAHYFYGYSYLTPVGRTDEAVREVRRAQELDPLSLIINANLGATLTSAHRCEEAIAQMQKALELDPNYFVAHTRLSLAYTCVGRYREAAAEAKKGLQVAPNVPLTLGALAIAEAHSGDRAGALGLLRQIEGQPRGTTPTIIAYVYAALGEKDQAFEWLEKGYEERDEFLPRIKVEPFADPLRSDPRFADLLRRMGLAP